MYAFMAHTGNHRIINGNMRRKECLPRTLPKPRNSDNFALPTTLSHQVPIGPGSTQYRKPMTSRLGLPPRSMMSPKSISPTRTRSLKLKSKNSAPPNTRTPLYAVIEWHTEFPQYLRKMYED